MYRFSQVSRDRKYGHHVDMIEIVKISDTEYLENRIGTIVEANGDGWMKEGMHTVCPVKTDNGWIIYVDGLGK